MKRSPGRMCTSGLLALLLTLLAGGWSAAAEPFRVSVILSEEGGAYTEVAEAISVALKREGTDRFRATVLVAGRDLPAQLQTGAPFSVVVSVGMRAASAVQPLGLRTPVLFTLVPRAALEKLVLRQSGSADGVRAGVYLDQPPERQLELIRLIIPAATKLGLIYGPNSLSLAPQLENAAAQLGLKVEAERVSSSDQVTVALQRVLERSEVLLGLPDPEVFNKNTVHNLLLAAYRAGDAVFAFSPAYVKAGALAGVYSSSAQIGTQAAELVVKLSNGSTIPELSAPKYFSVAVNRSVSRSMGIPIEDEVSLQRRLEKLAKLEP